MVLLLLSGQAKTLQEIAPSLTEDQATQLLHDNRWDTNAAYEAFSRGGGCSATTADGFCRFFLCSASSVAWTLIWCVPLGALLLPFIRSALNSSSQPRSLLGHVAGTVLFRCS
jgi:hypothetical protein